MLTTTFTELRQHAKQYFDAVEEGETVQIIRHGKVIAELSPKTDLPKEPSWKRKSSKLIIKGASLSEAILREREGE